VATIQLRNVAMGLKSMVIAALKQNSTERLFT